MYTDQHRDRRPVQGEQSQQQQLNHLVAAGLLGTQFGGGTKIAKGVGFKTEVKDTRTRDRSPTYSDRRQAHCLSGELVADQSLSCLRFQGKSNVSERAGRSSEFEATTNRTVHE